MADNALIGKMVSAILIPIIGIPLYEVGYDKVNDSFGGTDDDWVVTLYSIIFILVFGLTPLALLYSVLKTSK